MAKTRPPTPPDQDIWHRVSRTVSPLKKGSSKPDGAIPAGFMRVPTPKPVLRKPRHEPIGMRADKKTRRGRVEIDTKLDLHDLTMPQAFEALRRGIIRAYNQNFHCVLVITGKGIRGQGVLRQNLPGWLGHPDISPVIAEYASAHIRHGGNGAWYIFLKTR